MFKFKPAGISALDSLSVCFMAFTLVGCERKERVIDVRTPAGDVTVDRNIDSGTVEVETTRK